ncbi:MAG: hypothetical protein AAGA77_03590 [Bacteroidota bacterium]
MNININSSIIEPAFTALLANSKEDSELRMDLEILSSNSGPFAIKRKGNKIVESYPWPIGKEFSTLISSSYGFRDQKRLLKIFRVAERITQFISFCWLIQIWDTKRLLPNLELTSDFKTQFKNIHKPSVGTYLGLIRSISNILFNIDQPYFFQGPHIIDQTKKLVDQIEKLIVVRNKEVHFKEEIICEDAEEILANILVSSSFLVNFPMVSVKDINVTKHKLTEAKYVHVIDQLNSQRSEFSGGMIEMDEFTDSFSVLLIENIQSMGTYLNLSPLIINTEPFLASRGRSKVLQGLYVYSEKERENIKYSFVNESEIHSLNDMPQSNVFLRQWDNIFNVLSQ